MPASLAQEIEFDGGTVPGSLPYPKVRLKKRVLANRDYCVAHRLAAGTGLENAPSPARVAAFLSDEQRERLGRALQTSPTLDRADLTLYEIVKGWDGPAAIAWFGHQLREVDPATTEGAPANLGLQVMDVLANDLGNETLQTLVAAARDQLIEIYAEPAAFRSAPSFEVREAREAAVARKLLRDFRQALAAGT